MSRGHRQTSGSKALRGRLDHAAGVICLFSMALRGLAVKEKTWAGRVSFFPWPPKALRLKETVGLRGPGGSLGPSSWP
eukprot:2715525-Pyramimonas_sp.AAC.3